MQRRSKSAKKQQSADWVLPVGILLVLLFMLWLGSQVNIEQDTLAVNDIYQYDGYIWGNCAHYLADHEEYVHCEPVCPYGGFGRLTFNRTDNTIVVPTIYGVYGNEVREIPITNYGCNAPPVPAPTARRIQ